MVTDFGKKIVEPPSGEVAGHDAVWADRSIKSDLLHVSLPPACVVTQRNWGTTNRGSPKAQYLLFSGPLTTTNVDRQEAASN